MNTHDFCRMLLTDTMETVRRFTTAQERKDAWAHKSSTGTMEFHGPNDFYWHGQGCCLWFAKNEGWKAYLRHIAKEVE